MRRAPNSDRPSALAPTAKSCSSDSGAARGGTGSDAAVEALRCDCGRLLARVLRAAVELKCSRCKRVVILVDGRRYEQAGVGGCECLESLQIEKQLTHQKRCPHEGQRFPQPKRPAISRPEPVEHTDREALPSRRSNEV